MQHISLNITWNSAELNVHTRQNILCVSKHFNIPFCLPAYFHSKLAENNYWMSLSKSGSHSDGVIGYVCTGRFSVSVAYDTCHLLFPAWNAAMLNCQFVNPLWSLLIGE